MEAKEQKASIPTTELGEYGWSLILGVTRAR